MLLFLASLHSLGAHCRWLARKEEEEMLARDFRAFSLPTHYRQHTISHCARYKGTSTRLPWDPHTTGITNAALIQGHINWEPTLASLSEYVYGIRITRSLVVCWWRRRTALWQPVILVDCSAWLQYPATKVMNVFGVRFERTSDESISAWVSY